MVQAGDWLTIRDLLADSTVCPPGERLILEEGFDEHRKLIGDKLLMKLCEFSSYHWLHDANHNLKSAVEHGQILIAAPPPVAGEIYVPLMDDLDAEIEATIGEMSTIVTTELQNRTRWDTPTKGMRKDRYSAMLCAFDAARTILQSMTRPTALATGGWA